MILHSGNGPNNKKVEAREGDGEYAEVTGAYISFNCPSVCTKYEEYEETSGGSVEEETLPCRGTLEQESIG